MCIVIINKTPLKQVSLYLQNYKLLFRIQILCFYITQFFCSHVHFRKSDLSQFSPWHKRDNPPGSEWVKQVASGVEDLVHSQLFQNPMESAIQILCFYITQFFFSHVHFRKSDLTQFSPWHKRDNPPGSEWVKARHIFPG